MKTVIFTFILTFCTLVCSCQSSLDLRQTKTSAWVHINEGTVIAPYGCKMVQRTEPSTNTRNVYIQRREDEEPIPIYAHERSIEATLGHHGRAVLINDYFATKTCKVVVADIDSKKNWRIDEEAYRLYSQTAPKEWLPHHVIPEAIGFSPDDEMVLIAMKSGYVASSAEEAGQFGRSFQLWSYVVDSTNGALLNIYKTDGIVPQDWWQFEEDTTVDSDSRDERVHRLCKYIRPDMPLSDATDLFGWSPKFDDGSWYWTEERKFIVHTGYEYRIVEVYDFYRLLHYHKSLKREGVFVRKIRPHPEE